MDKFILTLIVTFSTVTCSKADEEPQIQIFEIRQARPVRERRGDEHQIDYQYYDPDGYDLRNKLEYWYRPNSPSKYKSRSVDEVTESLINKLRRIVQSRNHYSNRNDNDDNIFKYKDLKQDNELENNLKTPIVLVAHKDVLYHVIPQNQRSMQHSLQTALRSINFDENVEDRTAPPRTSVRYDYEYEE